MTAERDGVVAFCIFRVMNAGDFFSIVPTGKRPEFTGILDPYLVSGRLQEGWAL